MPRLLRPSAAAVGTFAFCLVWATLMSWPVLRVAADALPMDIGDPALNAAILHWNATTTPLTRDWWDFPAFDPATGVTTFTEHLLGLWPIASPVVWLTANPLVAYNTAFLLSFPLSGIAMFALVRHLTGSNAGAFAGALAFAFSPYRADHLSHLQMLMTWGMPLALLGLHRFTERGGAGGLGLFAAGWLVTALSNGYQMVFFGVYLLFWGLWFGTAGTTRGRLAAIAATGALASLPLLPLLWTYATTHAAYGFTRDLSEIRFFSAELGDIFRVSSHAAVPAAWLQPARAEAALYPGLAIVALAAAALMYRERRVRFTAAPAALRWATGLTALFFLSAALVAALTDVRFSVLGIRVSLTEVGKPLALGLAAAVGWLGSTRVLRPAFANRSAVTFYALTVPIMWTLSLGPEARLDGVTLVRELPYSWLLDVPGVQGLRVPARFWMLGTLSLAVLAGYGVAAMAARGRRASALAVACLAALLAEGWLTVFPWPADPFPGVQPDIAGARVLELPADSIEVHTLAMLRAVTGGYRTLNGYSGYQAPHFPSLVAGLGDRDATLVTELRRVMALHISVPADDRQGLRSWIRSSQADARLVGEAHDRALYALPTLPSTAAPPAREIAFTPIASSCGDRYLPDLMDGSLVTRWACGVGRPGLFITFDLGSPAAAVSGLVTILGPYIGDAPRRLLVEVSDDGTAWTPAWEGTTFAAALRAALEDPREVPVRIHFAPARGRYLRLTQTGEEWTRFWSIAELKVLSPS